MYKRQVLESLGGILRVEFADSKQVRWALPDEVLADPVSDADPFGDPGYAHPGCHVAVLNGSDDARRATFVAHAADGQAEIAWDDKEGKRELVPLAHLRRPRRADEADGLAENASLLCCLGDWLPGVASEITEEDCCLLYTSPSPRD